MMALILLQEPAFCQFVGIQSTATTPWPENPLDRMIR
jgi:hypothetical protein